MADVTQLSFFNAEAAHEYQRQQRNAELEALMIKHIGTAATRRWQKRVAKEQADMATFMQGYQRSPEMQAAIDQMRAEVLASTKPLSNDYALLGIEPGATKRDIKNAYRRQARKLHPDKGGDAEAFKQMYAAYRKLLTLVKE
jgi:hypothetical protein